MEEATAFRTSLSCRVSNFGSLPGGLDNGSDHGQNQHRKDKTDRRFNARSGNVYHAGDSARALRMPVIASKTSPTNAVLALLQQHLIF